MKLIGTQLQSKIGFADLYLERYGSGSVEELPEPDPDLFLIVAIPAYKEPDLAGSLRSLLSCDPPGVQWEILVNINYPENSGSDVIEISRQSLAAARQISQDLARSDVSIHCLWNPDLPIRHAGVGLARKRVMDQAVHRFNSTGRPEGVIVSFDADSACHSGYLKSITHFFSRNKSVRTANVYFEHPLSGGYDPRIYHSIAQYELYLRYMRLSVGLTGHPHAIHTVGSSFAVRCKTYIRVNGMGRDKAGEDFYFLHKCILLKRFWEINDTVVWPSVRESDRVSFGTGASIHRLQNETSLMVYNFDCFQPLTELFSRVGYFWQSGNNDLQPETGWENISSGLAEFMRTRNALQRIQEMRGNSASEDTFRDKFFAWFNGFMILRYLNEMHKDQYVKIPVVHAALHLAEILGISPADTAEELLVGFRNYERGSGNRRII